MTQYYPNTQCGAVERPMSYPTQHWIPTTKNPYPMNFMQAPSPNHQVMVNYNGRPYSQGLSTNTGPIMYPQQQHRYQYQPVSGYRPGGTGGCVDPRLAQYEMARELDQNQRIDVPDPRLGIRKYGPNYVSDPRCQQRSQEYPSVSQFPYPNPNHYPNPNINLNHYPNPNHYPNQYPNNAIAYPTTHSVPGPYIRSYISSPRQSYSY